MAKHDPNVIHAACAADCILSDFLMQEEEIEENMRLIENCFARFVKAHHGSCGMNEIVQQFSSLITLVIDRHARIIHTDNMEV